MNFEAELPHITVIGGGTGTSNMLRSLKEMTPNISAIVNMSDDGGSTGVLVRDRGGMPPGDLRQCLSALTPDSALSRSLEERDNAGHAIGNLLLKKYENTNGGIVEGTHKLARILNIVGNVIPVTDTPHRLALNDNHRKVYGETAVVSHKMIDAHSAEISHDPPVYIHDKALVAIESADINTIAPGNAFGSILPTLSVCGLADALKISDAPLVMVTNLVNKKGQTDGWGVMDYVRLYEKHLHGRKIDSVIYNDEEIAPALAREHGISYKNQVRVSIEQFDDRIKTIGAQLVANTFKVIKSNDKLLEHPRNQIVHDSHAIAQMIYKLAVEARLSSAA